MNALTLPLTVTTPSDREIVMTRVFAAPRGLVFDAHTKPELIRRWLLGPDGWSMPVCEVDLRVGGAYRWVWRRDVDGTEMSSRGTFLEIAAPGRLVSTERFEPSWYDGEAHNTLVLVEENGRTTLTQTMLYGSREVRDAVLKSGMESGVETSYQRLDAMFAAAVRR